MAKLLYQGHASIRITTDEGKIIYIDPFAGKGYDKPADLILITHAHGDHTALDLIKKRNCNCKVITHEDSLEGSVYKAFDLGYVIVEAVEAGNNPNHDINKCVGYIIMLSNNISIYISGDTSTTKQMKELVSRDIDYAFFCCDGKFNMDIKEAISCANMVKAKHSIPYHILPGEDFNLERAKLFCAENQMIIKSGEEIIL